MISYFHQLHNSHIFTNYRMWKSRWVHNIIKKWVKSKFDLQDSRQAHVTFEWTSIESVANSFLCMQFIKANHKCGYDYTTRFSNGGTLKQTTQVSKAWVSHSVSCKGKMLVSTCVTTSRRMGWSSYWKWMISARMIKVQHPKKVGATSQTIEWRSSPFEKANKMTQWQAKQPIVMLKISHPIIFST